MGVSYKRKELRDAMKLYAPVADCVAGEQRVKSRGTAYLPMPNDGGDEKEKGVRYASYKLRAVFYNVTKRTIDGFVGQIFSRDPAVKLPAELDVVGTDADGAGVNLVQLSTAAARTVIAYGRAGLHADYPVTDGALTKAQQDSGDIRPVITLYQPEQIINWRTQVRGAREILSLVVLEETYDASPTPFEYIERKQWRVLSLKNDIYTVEIYQDEYAAAGRPKQTLVPKDSSGNTFNEIPFIFIGAENNDSLIDAPPMYDIASLNISHYRNSADYEESVFITGQPTPVFTGLTQDWVTNVLKDKIYLGARAAVSLPTGADAKLLQAAPNSLPLEAMQHKEKQMVALGAKVVEKRAVVRTASEANIDSTNESSVLATIAKNVSAAFTSALKWSARYAGAEDKEISFVLNTDFDIAAMSPEARRQLMEEWQSGGISWSEYRTNLHKSGIASQKDEDARKDIDEEFATLPGMGDKLTGGNKPGGSNVNTQ